MIAVVCRGLIVGLQQAAQYLDGRGVFDAVRVDGAAAMFTHKQPPLRLHAFPVQSSTATIRRPRAGRCANRRTPHRQAVRRRHRLRAAAAAAYAHVSFSISSCEPSATRAGAGQRIGALQQLRLDPDERPDAQLEPVAPRAARLPAISSTCKTKAWQIASSCMAICSFGGEHLVIELPRGARLLRSHFLDRVADMHHYKIAGLRSAHPAAGTG